MNTAVRLEGHREVFIVDEITLEAQFQTLCAEWDDLLQESNEDSPFLTYDWFRCCLGAYGEGKNLFILAVRDGSTLVGIAPLWRYQDVIRGVQVKKIGFISSPDTPYVDFIILPQRRDEILKAVLQYLYIESRNIWDVVTLGQWSIQSPNCRLFQEILRDRLKSFFNRISSVTPYVPIKGEWEAFLQTRSARFRKTRRNIINRIRKLGKVELECIRSDATGGAFKEIIAVAEKSWKQGQGVGISSRKEATRFFERLTGLASQRGWLLLWLLKVNGVSIATEYDLVYGGKVYALRAYFDEAYRRSSPGAFLEYQILKRLFGARYGEYSTGPGLNNYKLCWTGEFRENVTLYICNDNVKGRVIWRLENIVVPFLRWIKDQTMPHEPRTKPHDRPRFV